MATLGAIGCNLGSVLAYEVGAYGGRPLIERFGKYILMNRHDLDVSDRFFQKYGSITVFIGRLLPVVRTFIALPAGIARMPRGKFHLYTFAGSWPWCFALAYFGFTLGERWDTDPRLKQWLHRFDALIVLALLIGIVYFVQSHWRNRLRANPKPQSRLALSHSFSATKGPHSRAVFCADIVRRKQHYRVPCTIFMHSLCAAKARMPAFARGLVSS